MQNILMDIFVQIGQRALEKSRAYYFPLPPNAKEEGDALSDVEFSSMLKDIDAFSAQFSPPISNDCRLGNSIDKHADETQNPSPAR